MRQDEVKFLGGVVKAADVAGLKSGDVPHFIFAGRSNVGKSSLLNALTYSKCARVSQSPGKTREMNFFAWGLTKSPNDRCVLVDLPGYGYAKVAATLRKQWGAEISQWLKTDDRICLVVALVDGRHGYLANDVELIEFLRSNDLPFVVAFTKMDKWKSNNQRQSAQKKLVDVSEKLGVEHYIFVSAVAKDGVRPLLNMLREAAKPAKLA